jgi:hypothetical protein
MRHAVARMVEWEAPPIDEGSEEWKISQHTDNGQLTHRLLMGDRKEIGWRRWCRMIQGAYRTIRPVAPLLIDTLQMEDAIIMQIHMLQNQLQQLGPYTMYTDGGWKYERMVWMYLFTCLQTARVTKEVGASSSSRLIWRAYNRI